MIVSSIVGGVNEQNSIVNKCADDWLAERVIIASNVLIIVCCALFAPSYLGELKGSLPMS